MPDFLAVTPKPYATRPPIYVAIEDDETLEWAARNGVAPFVGVEVRQSQSNVGIGGLASRRFFVTSTRVGGAIDVPVHISQISPMAWVGH